MTREAAARLRPSPPAFVEMRNRRSLYWPLLKVSTCLGVGLGLGLGLGLGSAPSGYGSPSRSGHQAGGSQALPSSTGPPQRRSAARACAATRALAPPKSRGSARRAAPGEGE
eukprot:scaffold22640_cov34-Phaeocystis_antarctica.AAC.1